jgi:hypothetical protein
MHSANLCGPIRRRDTCETMDQLDELVASLR